MFRKQRRKTLSTFIIIFVIAIAAIAATKDRYAELQLFSKVLNLIEQYYVEEVDIKKLIYGGIKGMLTSLDPHTNFLPPDVFKEFKTETTGEFGGVGIEISLQDDILTVMSPIEDTPAYKAGIKAGDKVVEINSQTTKGMSLAEAVSVMRGKKGTKVSVTIWREGWDVPKKFTLTREMIKIQSVKFVDMKEGFGFIRVTSFTEKTGDDLINTIEKFNKKNVPIKGLIMDLRNNAGGLLDQAIKVADYFIGEGVIVSTIGRNKKEKSVVYAKKENTRLDIPLVVLVNEYSASASEIVAGALKDHKRAIIMGVRTFGKGSVQQVVELGDGSGLKMTIARYYTPSGKSIQAHGIDPDINLEQVDTEALDKATIKRKSIREADIDGHLIGDAEVKEVPESAVESGIPFWKNKKEEVKKEIKEADESKIPLEERLNKDYQVQQALNYLKAWKVFKSVK
ncbi:MAG: S41 family peptidase [Oligoflexia bacterium]|nr:S41 family peptidase [Oligoflexia bacterium]